MTPQTIKICKNINFWHMYDEKIIIPRQFLNILFKIIKKNFFKIYNKLLIPHNNLQIARAVACVIFFLEHIPIFPGVTSFKNR